MLETCQFPNMVERYNGMLVKHKKTVHRFEMIANFKGTRRVLDMFNSAKYLCRLGAITLIWHRIL